MTHSKNTCLPLLTAAIFAVAAIALFAFYATAYKYHFFWFEQNQIFLESSDWLATYFSRPAWAAYMAGEYLTQFFYYLYAGPAILAIVVTITAALLYCALKPILPLWANWILTAAMFVWLVFTTFPANYQLASTLSITGSLLLYLGCKAITPTRLSYIGLLIIIPLAYWMMGYGAALIVILLLLSLFRVKPSKSTLLIAFAGVLLIGLTPIALGVKNQMYPEMGKAQTPDMSREAALSVETEYYFGNYDKAIENALKVDSPNAVTAFYYYLSQAKKDSLPDNLLNYTVKDLGTLYSIGEDTPVPVINMMNDLYYELGDMMYAERAAMMHNVFSPRNRNARMIKRLAEVNLVSGDTAAALKHLRILDDTHAYRDWARRHTPGKMTEAAEAEIAQRRAFINTQDTMRLGDNCRTILLELLASNPSNTIALDYLLCTDLLLKEMDTFKADYDQFCMDRGAPRLRPLYQQALMIYLAGTNAPESECQRYGLSADQLQRFRAYNAHRGSKDFADTYWYYFDTHSQK